MGRWIETPPKLTGNASQQSAPEETWSFDEYPAINDKQLHFEPKDIQIRIPGCMHLSAVWLVSIVPASEWRHWAA